MSMCNISISSDGITVTEDRVLKFQTKQSVASVRESALLPQMGEAHPGDATLFCSGITINAVDTFTWTAQIVYKTKVASGQELIAKDEPWTAPPAIEKTPLPEITKVCEKFYKDSDSVGNPTGDILLPTGKPFDNPPLIPVKASRLVVEFATTKCIDDALAAAEYTVNAGAVTINRKSYPEKTLHMEVAYSNIRYNSKGKLYYVIHLQMLHNPEGHSFRPLLCDYCAKDVNKIRPVKLNSSGLYNFSTGDKITEPARLAQDGTLLTTNPADQVESQYGNFPYLPPVDWSALQIPTIKGEVKRK